MLKKAIFIMLLIMVLASITAYAADTLMSAQTSTSGKGTAPVISGKAVVPQKITRAKLPMNGDKATEKLSRGLNNIILSPFEYIYQIPASQKQSPDYLTGFFVTAVRGTGYMIARFATGIYDVVTSPFPMKTNYKPLMEPETIFGPVADAVTIG